MGKYAIETVGLTKVFREKKAVDSVNLAVRKNELFGLLGVNGAGKTTVIRMLCRLLKPTEGEIFVGGEILTDTDAKRKMNFSPQETAVAPNLTVRENLELMTGLYGFDRKESKESVERMIEEFNLTGIADSKAKTLSGGWQRRLSIAMAMVTEPEILFLDEPTLGLDVIARRELWQTVSKLRERTTIILTTHYLEEAEALCDRIAVMEAGRVKAFGTAEELKKEAGADGFEEAFIALAGARREIL